MKFQALTLGLVLSFGSTMAMAQGSVLTGRDAGLTVWPTVQVAGAESSVNLAPSAGMNQHKPATVASQAGETSQDGNTLQMVLLALLVMGSIALRRSRSAR